MDNFKINMTDWLELYDNDMEIFSHHIKNIEFIFYETTPNELENDFIYFYDKNKKLIMKSHFNIFGTYDISQSVFTWAWSINALEKKWVTISKKILQYGFSLPPADNLREQLINSKFIVSEQIQIDMQLAIAFALTKNSHIFQHLISANDELNVSVKNYTDIEPNENTDIGPNEYIKIKKIDDGQTTTINYYFLFDVEFY